MSRTVTAKVALIAVTQLALVGLAVAPQLSARVLGDTYVVRVAPVDPVDPFRGAYVALDYPDLRHDDSQSFGSPGLGALEDGEEGDVYVSLVEDGGVWVAGEWSRARPEEGPYLACDWRTCLSWCSGSDTSASRKSRAHLATSLVTTVLRIARIRRPVSLLSAA